MNWLWWTASFGGGLFLELVVMGVADQPLIFVVRPLYIVAVLCSSPSWPQHAVALLVVVGSAFLQNLSVSTLLGALVLLGFGWHFGKRFFHPRRVTMSILGSACFIITCLIDGTFYWTPSIVIANIIIVPAMVWLFCKV